MLNHFFRFFLLFFGVANGVAAYAQAVRIRCGDTSDIRRQCLRYVSREADRGYPFAEITADSAVFAGRRRVDVYCSARLMQRYRVENVYLMGGEGLAPYYVYSLTGIAPGAVYCESRINAAARRLSTSGAAIALQPAEVEFHPGGLADVYVYLKTRRSNSIGASLALNRDANDGKYFVTGSALADLCNNFGYGEKIYFAWEGYDRRSQMLDLRVKWPYAFQTPLVPDVAVNVTRADTLCLTAQVKAALGFALSPDVVVKAVVDVRRLASSGSDDYAVDSPSRNASTSLYGIGVDCRKTYQDSSLVKIECMATGGTRRSGGASGSAAEILSVIESDLPLRSWARYEGRWTARQMYFSQKPDIHECSPIGGVGSLRGFMANELRATGLVTLCNTVRVLLSGGFSVQMFYDQAFYKCDAVQTVALKDSPSGFGAGIGISNGAARVDIGWAIGRERGEMRPLKDAKTLIIMRLEF